MKMLYLICFIIYIILIYVFYITWCYRTGLKKVSGCEHMCWNLRGWRLDAKEWEPRCGNWDRRRIKKSDTWNTARRGRKAYSIRVWSKGRRENYFPQKKRDSWPSLCWCDQLKWWLPPSWALIQVICDQACPSESCVLWNKTLKEAFAILCHGHHYPSAGAWFFPSTTWLLC